MIVAVCGYGTSGASAVLDFLRGFGSIQVVPFEFQLLHQADGLSDLKYHLTESRERVACNAAIKRFRKLMFHSISGRRIQKIVGADYKRIVDTYIDRITIASWYGRSNYDPLDVSDRSANKLLCFLEQAITFGLRKINRVWCFPGYRERFFSILDAEQFDSATKEFLQELFGAAGIDLNEDLVLDMLLSATNPSLGMEFFDTIKAIVVVRDPRDTYIRSKVNVYLNSFMPQSSVEDFCAFYKTVRQMTVMNEDTLCIQYEDLIYKYEETKKRISAFLEFGSPENEFRFFNPNVSVKYTNLAKNYPQHAQAIAYIETHLPEYLYEFGEYQPIEIKTEYRGGF